MSGGRLDYFYSDLESHVGDFGDKELDDLVKDLAKLFHDREWFLSSDTCEGAWVESRDKFKQKWFTEAGRKDRIELYLAEIRNDVLSMLGLSDRYCINCWHWKAEDEKGSEYGWCDLEKHCMMHRHETCDRFVPNEDEK